MQSHYTPFDEIATQTAGYLKQFDYSDSTMAQYHSAWNHLKAFMSKKGEIYVTTSVVDDFIYDLVGSCSFNELTRSKKRIITYVNVLVEYQKTGSVKFRRAQVFRPLNGSMSATMRDFVTYKKGLGIATSTEREYRYHLQQFSVYLQEKDISSTFQISRTLLLDYANSLVFAPPSTRARNLSVLKGYLRFLYEKELLTTDLSKGVPKCKRIKQPQLPSTYTKDEVEKILGAIERSSPKGKRDYAMVLITARLGLRASDVCCLKFENLLWEQNLIRLPQNKTGEIIDLPLLPEIGEAVIDYLKYGRPQSSLPYAFLHVNAPYDRLDRSTLHSIVTLYIRRAGIKFENDRKHGPHALRHSLTSILLEKKTPLPVISEVLGHQSTESTRYYLRIDLSSLRQCALDVPPIGSSFYGRGRENGI